MKRETVCGLLILCLASGGAQAAACNQSLTDIGFGVITQLDPQPTDVQGTITVECQAEAADLAGLPPTAIVDYQIRIDGGTAGNVVLRALQGPGATLRYNIYTDPGRQSVWGDGGNGTTTQSGQFVFTADEVLQGTPKSAGHLSYARIPPNVNVVPGQYSDTVTVTLVF